MKLSEISMENLIYSDLLWEDFEEDPHDENLLEALRSIDSDARKKIDFLNQAESGELLDMGTLCKLDFYEVDFSEFARWFIAKGQYDPDGNTTSDELGYSRDYSDLKLLIQDMGDRLCLLYLRDYSFGFIMPLGLCEIEYGPDFEDTDLDRETFFAKCTLPEIQIELWDERFNLGGKIFDYYHTLPDIDSPLIKDRVSLKSLLTVKEAAKVLDVSEARVKKMVADKILEGFKFGNKLLVTAASLNSRLAQIEQSGKPTRGKKPGENKRFNQRPSRNDEGTD